MNERRKIENRRNFNTEVKDYIRYKSNCRCSHCGKDLKSNFTIEHVIPLNKGGSNDLSNLVALCQDCNTKKDDFIYYPTEYYKYLKDEFLHELELNQSMYYDEFDWLSPTQVMPEDTKELKVYINPKGLRDRKGDLILIQSTVLLKKCYYKDLDDVYNFLLKHMRCDVLTDEEYKTHIKGRISKYFDKGVIYCITSKIGEIKCVIPIVFKHLDELDSEAPRGGVIPVIDDLFICNDTCNLASALSMAVKFILGTMVKCFEKPVYFGMFANTHSNVAIELAGMEIIRSISYGYSVTEVNVMDKLLAEACDVNRKAGRISYIIGKWIESDESASQRHLDRAPTSEVKGQKTLKTYKLYDIESLEHFRSECIEFGNFVSKEFGYGYRGRKKSKVTKKGLGLELIDLPTASIIIPPKSNLYGTIPLHIKKQIDEGRQKPLRVSVDNVISKRDVATLVYLIGKGKDTIKCYRELRPINEDIKVPKVTKFKPHKKVNVCIEELTFPKGTDYNMEFDSSVKCLAEIKTIGITTDGVICKKDVPYALYLKSQGVKKLSCYCN